MFFFGIGMCEGRSSPVTGDTCAFFFFVDIYFTVVSRFSSKHGKKRSFCGFAQFFVRHTAEVSWKIQDNFKVISFQGSGKCHFYANKSPFNYFTRYATFIKSSLLAFPTPSFSWLDFSILHNRRRSLRIFYKFILMMNEFLLAKNFKNIFVVYINIFLN